jgi:DNA invertase Pin-like site-specific DNA recombinase
MKKLTSEQIFTKMMSSALAKYYRDQHSESIKRGIRAAKAKKEKGDLIYTRNSLQ